VSLVLVSSIGVDIALSGAHQERRADQVRCRDVRLLELVLVVVGPVFIGRTAIRTNMSRCVLLMWGSVR
jgi:hypothetical protein